MNKEQIDQLRLELSLKAKHGIDFITAATIVWSVIAYLWTLGFTAYDKSILTFIVGGITFPMAFMFSKVFKTQWKVPDNPLQPLGLWLNIAQLFYFPFLVFVLLKHPDYFVMTYAIITGAHFFPYAWFYREKAYAVMAGVIPVGALLLSLKLGPYQMYYVAGFMAACLFVLVVWLYRSYLSKSKTA